MSDAVPAVPSGHASIIPYLAIDDAARAIEFYALAFGAREIVRFATPEGRIGHAELQIGTTRLMLSDEFPKWGVVSPQTLGGTPVFIMIYVDNVDEVFARAVSAGARQLLSVRDGFYGDRSGRLQDPFGHRWIVSTHKEDVSAEQMNERARKRYGMSLQTTDEAET